MIGLGELLESMKHGALTAIIAPTMPKGIIQNILEKIVIVTLGAGAAIYVNDKQQDNKIDEVVKSIEKLDAKLDRLDHNGSRTEAILKNRVDEFERRMNSLDRFHR